MTRTSSYCPKLFLAVVVVVLTTASGCAATRQTSVGGEAARNNAIAVSPVASQNAIAGVGGAGNRVDRNADTVGMRTAAEEPISATRNATDGSVESCNSGGCSQCSR